VVSGKIVNLLDKMGIRDIIELFLRMQEVKKCSLK
jgi:hypothetical protein